jgi:hypothetical protein
MTFAFRGATHLMTPEDAGVYLAIRMAGRQWELKSWREYYRMAPTDWPVLGEGVREALTEAPLTVKELSASITARPQFRHLAPILAENPWGVMKVLGWHGEMSFGPMRGRTATFQRLDRNPRWAGIPPIDEAGPCAVEAYLRTYGPSTSDNVGYWLGAGLSARRKRLAAWLEALGDRLVEVDVEGTPAMVLGEDLDELAATAPTTAVRLLPAYDQWLFGPGTADPRIVPPGRRQAVTRGANVVIVGGLVSGTWSEGDDEIVIEWFPEAGPPPSDAIGDEVGRLATILGRPLRSTLRKT